MFSGLPISFYLRNNFNDIVVIVFAAVYEKTCTERFIVKVKYLIQISFQHKLQLFVFIIYYGVLIGFEENKMSGEVQLIFDSILYTFGSDMSVFTSKNDQMCEHYQPFVQQQKEKKKKMKKKKNTVW